MIILQNFILPQDNKEVNPTHLISHGKINFTKQGILLEKGAAVEFNTYFNSLSLPLWMKKLELSDMKLQIKGTGKIILSIHHFSESGDVILERKEMLLQEDFEEAYHLLSTSFTSDLGLIYPEMEAQENTILSEVRWITEEASKREVRLGICITHYNRQEEVKQTIKKLNRELLMDQAWKEKISLLIVDNSNNLDVKDSNVKILPNSNLGGAGGFTRGLLYHREKAEATHVLFMDDDAHLHVESIKRAYTIMRLAKTENAAVGGALLDEKNPALMLERGGVTKEEGNPWAPLNNNEDISKPEIVLKQENEELKAEYAAWWFFMFPVQAVKYLPLPLFIRGDDVAFGKLNSFDLIFGNGIASYSENFATKYSLMALYLNRRNSLFIHSLFSKRSLPVALTVFSYCVRSLLMGRYSWYEVTKVGVEEFLKADKAWFIENSDNHLFFQDMTSYVTNERKLEDISVTSPVVKAQTMKISWRDAIFCLRRIFPKGKVYVSFTSNKNVDVREIAGYRKIVYLDEGEKSGAEVEVSYGSLVTKLCYSLFLTLRVLFFSGKRRKDFSEHLDDLTSEKLWREIYDQKIEG